jgi:hypothetical protein
MLFVWVEGGLLDFFFNVIHDKMGNDGVLAIENVVDGNEVLI